MRQVWMITLVLVGLGLPISTIQAQGVFLNPSTPTFRPYGSLSVSGTRSLTQGDTLHRTAEGFIAIPLYGRSGYFGTFRAEEDAARALAGYAFALDAQIHGGVGYGREFRYPKDRHDSRYPSAYLTGSDIIIGFIDAHDRHNQLLLRAEYDTYGFQDDYSLFVYPGNPYQSYQQTDFLWYDASLMGSVIGDLANGIAFGVQARRHQGNGARLDFNQQNSQLSFFGGWDNEKKQFNDGRYKGADNRLNLNVRATLRF